jgi:hypothetical protein
MTDKLAISTNLPGKYRIVDDKGNVYARCRLRYNVKNELKRLSRLLMRNDLMIEYD